MLEKSIILVADNIRSLENVGSLFRTADAVGVTEILCVGISGYPDAGALDHRRPYLRIKQHKALAKTALSGISVPFRYFPSVSECISYIQSHRLFVLVVEQDETAVDLFSEYQIQYPLCVIVGNELTGVSKEFIDIADLIVQIPMHGNGISLNVSVSGGIVLYQLSTHRQ